MCEASTFKFMDDALNDWLVALLKKAKVKHAIDRDGVVRYERGDEELVGNELICSIRNKVFSAWQLLSCPADHADRYRRYMIRRGIEYREEWINGQMCFRLPRKHRPHAWALDAKHPMAASKKSRLALVGSAPDE